MSTIDELNRLHEAATKGPWRPQAGDEHDIEADSGEVAGNYDYEEGGIVNVEDRDAIVALHNAWPAIHRLAVAARGLAAEAEPILRRSRLPVMRPWEELFEALRALDDKEQRT